jgi:hypothetical protein
MPSRCSICTHPDSRKIIASYFDTWSYRKTASRFRIGYRSLQRHINRCIPFLLERIETVEFEERLKFVALAIIEANKGTQGGG